MTIQMTTFTQLTEHQTGTKVSIKEHLRRLTKNNIRAVEKRGQDTLEKDTPTQVETNTGINPAYINPYELKLK